MGYAVSEADEPVIAVVISTSTGLAGGVLVPPEHDIMISDMRTAMKAVDFLTIVILQ